LALQALQLCLAQHPWQLHEPHRRVPPQRGWHSLVTRRTAEPPQCFQAGPDNDQFKYTLNIQPVIPVSLSTDWNLIARIIQPVIYQEELSPGVGSKFGLGDMNPSLFFSPKEPFYGWIWGAGPVFLLPTATDDALGTGQWAAGPTAVGLRQRGPWTYGLLANHLWSFAGEGVGRT
jgi:hypothetical protein